MKYLENNNKQHYKINTMIKKVILIAILAIIPFIGNAQTSIFDKFDGNDDVTTIVVSKKAFELMAKFGGSSEEAQEYASMVSNIDGLKVFTTESKAIAIDMQNTIKKYLKTANLSELLRVDDKDANVNIYVKEGRDDDHVKELLMFVNEFSKNSVTEAEAVIVSLTGDIDLNKIAELTEQLNISGAEHLKKAKQ